MFHKDENRRKKRSIRTLLLIGLVSLVVLLGFSGASAAYWYKTSTSAIDSSNQTVVDFQVEAGQSPAVIASNLKQNELIKSERAFSVYIKINNKAGSLQAGDYLLKQSMSVEEIVEELSNGKVESRNFTILAGKRLDQIKKIFLSAGYSEADTDKALDAKEYNNHPISKFKPIDASLEGYIYPETFQITDNTTAKAIVTKALDETYRKLTPDLVNGLEAQGLNVHDAIILASIIEKEVARPSDRPLVAQVFLKRLKEGIELGSDVTYIYASVVFGGRASPDLDNPYNTRIYTGLPPGPVSNFEVSSLEAIVNPSNTEYLYFVSGDDGTTHYAKTFAEHNQNIANFCSFNCLLPDQRDDIIDL